MSSSRRSYNDVKFHLDNDIEHFVEESEALEKNYKKIFSEWLSVFDEGEDRILEELAQIKLPQGKDSNTVEIFGQHLNKLTVFNSLEQSEKAQKRARFSSDVDQAADLQNHLSQKRK